MTAVSSEQTRRAAAEAWALTQIEGGKVPASSAGNITLKQFSANFFFVWGRCDYIKRRLAEGKRIVRTYAEGRRKYIEKFIIPTFGRMKLSEITRPAVEKWRMKLLDQGLAAGTVKRVRALLEAGKAPDAIARELNIPLMYVKVMARIRSAMAGVQSAGRQTSQ